jgi:hypothetical protein
MKKRLLPLSLLLLTLSSCPNTQQNYTKPREIQKEGYTIQINVQASKNSYLERVKDSPIDTIIIGSTKSQLESQLEDSEDALKDIIKKDVELFLRQNNHEIGIYTLEVDVLYSTGRRVFMIDDFEVKDK